MSIDLPAHADRRQQVPDDAGTNWADVAELDFFARDGSFGGFAVMGLNPRANRGWFWGAVVGDDRPLVLVVDDELPLPASPTLEVRSSGIWTDFIPQVPMVHYTVGLEAFGVGLDDPSEVFNGLRGDRTPMGFDLEWETEGDGWPLEPQGFELPCRAHGEILLGHEEFDFDGLGTRRRWWGDDSRRTTPGMWLSGWWDDGTPITGSSCELLTRVSAETFELSHPAVGDKTLTATVRSVAPVPVITPSSTTTSQRWRMLCRLSVRPDSVGPDSVGPDSVGSTREGVGWLDLR